MKGSRELLPGLGEVLLGERDPARDGGGVTGPGLVDRVGLDPALLSAEARHFYSLRNLIDLTAGKSLLSLFLFKGLKKGIFRIY